MSAPSGDPAGTTPAVMTAVQAADAAARAAGVLVREVSLLAELEAACRLFDLLWQPDPTRPPMTAELLRALTKSGNYVAGAFDGDELVGACVGFFGAPADRTLHSHIAGVSTAARGRHVGFALKAHQRAWSMVRNVSTITWTFDPLVRRNAYFNLVKLAARPHEYLPDFYGAVHDAINSGEDTDRLFVHWRLDSPDVAAACAGTSTACAADADAARAAGAAVALGISERGDPVVGFRDAPTLLVAVPDDIEALRLSDPGRSKDWRVAVKEVLAGSMAEGAVVTGFDRAGWYLLTRPGSTEEGSR